MPEISSDIYFNTFENAGIGIANLSPDFKFIMVNHYLCSKLGFYKDELYEKSMFDLLLDEDKEPVLEFFSKCSNKAIDSFSTERKFRRKDNTPVNINLTVSYNESAAQNYFICILEDVSNRKEVEKRLHESEAKYKQLIHNSPIAITRLKAGTDGYEFVNEEFVRQSGYSEEEFAELSKIETNLMVHHDDRERVIQSFDVWANNHYPGVHNIQYRIFNKDHEIVWLNAFCYTERDLDGNITAMDQMYVDITEMKRIEEELKRTLSLLNSTLESTEDGIMVADGKGRIMSFNKKFAEMWNLPSELLDSRNDEKAIEFVINQLKNPNQFIVKVMELYSRPDEVSFDIIEFNDGRIIERYSQPQKIGSESIGRVWSFRDVTHRIKAEQSVTSSLREKETLLKEIHHRVKNNLQVVSSLLNLESKFITDKDDLAIFKDSQNRVRSMALVHETLYNSKDLSRIHFREYAIKLTDNIRQSYKSENKKIEMIRRVQDAIYINIDAAIPLGLLVNEIITNCYKYAFKNMESGTIEINIEMKDDIFEMIISDNGCGLPDGLDLNNTKTLGFQLINTLITQLDGEVIIDRNKGTKFTIRFSTAEYQGRF